MAYSVIIPTYNRSDLVVRAIRSVYAQTCPPGQVIVIDDASEPPLLLPPDLVDRGICLIRHERSVGGARARNAGLAAASYSIVAFLDDDDEWLPVKMETQLAWLREHPEARLVSCGHLRHEAGRRYLEIFTQQFVEKFHQYDNYFGSFSYLVVCRPPGGLLLDPFLPALQDWDYALRVTRGHSFGIIEESLVKYHAHDLPRITNRPGNHLRGLRRCFLNHRSHFSLDARRWLLGRVVFERARVDVSPTRRLRRILFSVSLAARCSLPLSTKVRVIARRIASLGFSPRAIANIRSTLIACIQGLRADSTAVPLKNSAVK